MAEQAKKPRLYYILDDNKNPVAVDNLIEWAKWFEGSDRVVKQTLLWPGIVRISTVFLGIDHGFSKDAKPVLFETMVFGGVNDQYQRRYCTYTEAFAGHKKQVKIELLWYPVSFIKAIWKAIWKLL